MVDVAHYPEHPETYRLTHRIGAVLVRYDGCEYSAVIDTDAVIQQRTFNWFIAVITRDLGWAYGGQPSGPSPGAYAVLEAVRSALTGFFVKGFRGMYPVSEEHEGRDKEGGAWYYNARYRHWTMALEQSTTPNLALLQKVQAFEEGGQSTIASPAAPFTFGGPAPGTIQLPQINLSNVVVWSNNLETEYVAGTDYTVDATSGLITRIAIGGIGANATVQIAFDYADVVTAIQGAAERRR